MSVVTTLAGRPISDPGVRRIQFSLVGYAIASFAIFLAWVGAAGVETSPLNFYSGPTPASVVLLFVAVAILVAGATVVTFLGSIYGNETGSRDGTNAARM